MIKLEQFISNFGVKNFMIIFAIVIVILIALIVLFLIEKYAKRDLTDELTDEEDEIEEVIIKKESPVKREKITIKKENINIEEDTSFIKEIVEPKDDLKEEIVYAENKPTKKEIKDKLDEVTKSLIEEPENKVIGPTRFEIEQEEKSVISYEELKKASKNIDKINDNLLRDEGNEPITLDELYKVDTNDQIGEVEALIEEMKEYREEKKFRNSAIISPVFGVYGQSPRKKQSEEELEKTVDLEELEEEIRKTEEFLRELKKLKSKL